MSDNHRPAKVGAVERPCNGACRATTCNRCPAAAAGFRRQAADWLAGRIGIPAAVPDEDWIG